MGVVAVRPLRETTGAYAPAGSTIIVRGAAGVRCLIAPFGPKDPPTSMWLSDTQIYNYVIKDDACSFLLPDSGKYFVRLRNQGHTIDSTVTGGGILTWIQM
jgi:hypothetical protein